MGLAYTGPLWGSVRHGKRDEKNEMSRTPGMRDGPSVKNKAGVVGKKKKKGEDRKHLAKEKDLPGRISKNFGRD